MKTITNISYAAFALFALACSALLPTTQAVVPAPDGGYANYNTAEGQNALFSLTTGIWNTALGGQALFKDNVGSNNTAVGLNALFFNVSGSYNTATGAQALQNNIGSYNTANGYQALFSNTTGSENSAFGFGALFHNTTGTQNTAVGLNSLYLNTGGSSNTATGWQALQNNTTGSTNTAYGNQALSSNTTGTHNTACGIQALMGNTTGGFNIAVGSSAGANLTTGSNNIDIGHSGFAGDHDTIRIGGSNGIGTFIDGIYGVSEGGAINPVYINSGGQLGTQPPSSSRRFKKEIKPIDQVSEAILLLKPVTFHYKSDATATPQFGLIAEDVAEVNPDLVVRDKNGEVYTVRYDAVNAMLLNEFLKDHRKVAEQEATITQLKVQLQATTTRQQKQIEALTAGLQKVSAQLELSKSAPQTVLNNQ